MDNNLKKELELVEKKLALYEEKIAGYEKLIAELKQKREEFFVELEILKEQAVIESLERNLLQNISEPTELSLEPKSTNQFTSSTGFLALEEYTTSSNGNGHHREIALARNITAELAELLELFEGKQSRVLSHEYLQQKLKIDSLELDRLISSLHDREIVEDEYNPRHYRLNQTHKTSESQPKYKYKDLPPSPLLTEATQHQALSKVILSLTGRFRAIDIFNLLYSPEQRKNFNDNQSKKIKHYISQTLCSGCKNNQWNRVAEGLYQNKHIKRSHFGA